MTVDPAYFEQMKRDAERRERHHRHVQEHDDQAELEAASSRRRVAAHAGVVHDLVARLTNNGAVGRTVIVVV